MNLSSSTLLALALKRLITYLVSLEVPPIVSIRFTALRNNGLETGFLIQIEYLQTEQKQGNIQRIPQHDVEKFFAGHE